MISRSALSNKASGLQRIKRLWEEDAQDLKEGASLLVRLSQETQREGRHGVVRPGAVKDGEESLTVLQEKLAPSLRLIRGSERTLDSSVLRRFRKSLSSGEVIMMRLRF